jgi:lysophospholipase L1-like esterase
MKASAEAITIVAFGDSITHAGRQILEDRWPEILRRALQERFSECRITMINAGVGGNTSREGLRRIDQDVLIHDPHFVTVEFGNDMTPDPARHVSLEEFTKNLSQIRTKVAERNNGRVVMLTFPPTVDQWTSSPDDEFYKRNGGADACEGRYRDLTREFARTHGVPLADIDLALRKEMSVRGPGEFILNDGVHLTTRGNHVVAELLLAVLSPEIESFLTRRG